MSRRLDHLAKASGLKVTLVNGNTRASKVAMHSELIAQFQSSWTWLAVISVAVLLGLTAFGYAILKLFPQLRITRSPYAYFCECLLHGFILFSISALTGIFFGLRIHYTFLLLSAFSACMWLFSFWKPITGKQLVEQGSYARSDKRLECAALVLIVVGSFLWSDNNFKGINSLDGGIVLAPWADIFLNARQIGDFAQFRGDVGTLNMFMYGEPLPVYHYGSYMVSSLVSYLGDIPSIQIATSFYPLLGMLLTGAAMLVLAGATTGAATALLAVILLFFFPDPSCWARGITRLQSYYFFQQVNISGAYAVAIMGLALAYAMRAFQVRSLLFCAASLCVFSLAGLFKAQIILAYSFFFFVFIIWNADWISKERRLIVAGVFVTAFYLAASRLADIPNAPSLTITYPGIEWNLAHTFEGIQKQAGFLSKFGLSFAPPYALSPASLLIAVTVVFLMTYGILFPASAVLAWNLRHNLQARKMLWLLVFGFVSNACVRMLIANNTGNGDFGEVNRKTFVWPYFLIVFSFSSLLLTYFAQRSRAPLPRKPLLVALGSSLFLFSAISARDLQNWPRLENFRNVPIPTGLFESALYLRQRSEVGDVVQLCENDSWNQLATLSERPVYIARAADYGQGTPRVSVTEQQRFAVVDHILQQRNIDSAGSLARQAKISWMLMSPKCRAEWENQSSPAFSSNGYRLYKLSSF